MPIMYTKSKYDKSDRRSVEHDLPDWPGWPKFLKYLDYAEKAPYPEDSKLYFLLLFETGCRASEVIELKLSMFKFNDEAIVCENAPVLKKKKRDTRDIIMKLDELNPLGYELIDLLEACKTEYLLPKRLPFNRDIIGDKHTSSRTVYNRISEIHKDLWPHGVRGYRASMLVHERDFRVQQLVSWFKWVKADTAIHYTRTKNLAHDMGIKRLPQ